MCVTKMATIVVLGRIDICAVHMCVRASYCHAISRACRLQVAADRRNAKCRQGWYLENAMRDTCKYCRNGDVLDTWNIVG